MLARVTLASLFASQLECCLSHAASPGSGVNCSEIKQFRSCFLQGCQYCPNPKAPNIDGVCVDERAACPRQDAEVADEMISPSHILSSEITATLPLEPLGGSLQLSYKDCGDASTHAKITGLTPSTATIGRKATITGTGELDEDVTDATFSMQVGFSKGVPLLECNGDASVGKKCSFPFFSGSLAFEGVNFPIKAGPQDINVDLYLSPLLPSGLIKTTTEVTAVSKSGEKIFCMKVITGSSDENGAVALSYEDCGDSQTHAKITGLSPSSVTPGRTTKITGKGILDKDITDGNFRTQTFYSGGDLAACSGDAGKEQTCGLLGGLLGSLTFDALSFPVKKGSTSVSVDLSLNPLIPAALAQTVTTVTASTKGGDKLFCMEVFTAPVSGESTSAVVVV